MGRVARRDHPEPLCRLVRFDATDGVALAGLLYEPPRRTRRVAVFVHGTGGASVFDSRRTNLLAAEFVSNGFAFFPFNNRGAHLLRRLRKKKRTVGGGMAYERIRDCVPDIDGAIRFLRRRGYREIHLIGHSTGANKIAVYHRYKHRNPVRGYVLLAGGDDTGLLYDQLGRRRFFSTLKRARARRNSEELVPASLSALPMSWRALYDTINPDGDYNVFPYLEILRGVRLSRGPRFRHLRGIRKPALVVYGDRDEYCYGNVSRCVGVLAEQIGPKPNFEFAILENADHGFGRREGDLARLILAWLLRGDGR
ncbi:MAG TPA: alpha/beta hydrolase [Thermoanaerobaculia bacterium]|nr:alpha/beta hydrolase [Thermoanaerobaculia bacterium]